MNSFFPALFKPGYIGSTWVRNRIVMAPMATNFAYTNGEVSEALDCILCCPSPGRSGTGHC